MSEIDWPVLEQAAIEVASSAHAPYSGLHVGAAGLTADGRVVRDDVRLRVHAAPRPRAGDVVISEIDRTGQWIELFNRTPFDLDLGDWTLRDDGGDLHVLEGRVLGARAHLLLRRILEPHHHGPCRVRQ